MKVLSDSGWEVKARSGGRRCYYVSERIVDFEATSEEVQAFIDTEKKAWYGQEFSARVIENRIYFRRGIDSGD